MVRTTSFKEAYPLIEPYAYAVIAREWHSVFRHRTYAAQEEKALYMKIRDNMVGGISCDGSGDLIYVWHHQFESITTAMFFKKREPYRCVELDP
jgi:hypothetical protein